MDWSKTNVTSTLHICWGGQAGLFYHYGIPKYELPAKLFGVFSHRVLAPNEPLMRGFDDQFTVPHSRYTGVRHSDIQRNDDLMVLSDSSQAGVYLVMSRDRRQIFLTGHPEYDANTLNNEYLRDKDRGLNVSAPLNYFQDNDPAQKPLVSWRGHAHLLYSNWLNYYVYQSTPYYWR
jgi:homoserine O-succinyltransferase